MQRVGVIRAVARYPVKSMRGEACASLPLTLQGFEEDRRFAFVQAESRSAFPWLTAREMPELLRWQTSVEKAGTADAAVTITTPAGERWLVASNEVRQAIEKRFGKPVFLLRDYRGSFDVANVSLISEQTVQGIAEESQTEANPWRFRPNLLVNLEFGAAFDELEWGWPGFAHRRQGAHRRYRGRPALRHDHARPHHQRTGPPNLEMCRSAPQQVRRGLRDRAHVRGSTHG